MSDCPSFDDVAIDVTYQCTCHQFRPASPWSPNVGDEPLCGQCHMPETDRAHGGVF